MKNIDFLPAKYREQRAAGKRQLWRTAVLILFGAAVGSTAASQHWFHKAAAHELAEVRAQHQQALEIKQSLAELQQQLKMSQQSAELYTYLQHPWPRTQLLAEIVRPAGQNILLQGVSLKQEATNTAIRRNSRSRGREDDRRETDQRQPAERDLEQLRNEMDNVPTVIELSGVTRDTAALHSYVALLSYSPLLAKAELSSLESIESGEMIGAAQFRIRLLVRPGYGQPGGPTHPPSSTARTAADSQR